MQTEFDVAGTKYRADKLDAFKQLHLARKLAPMVPKLVPVFVKLQGKGTEDLAGLADAAGPFAEVLAAMSDEDVEYIVTTCLSVVKREQSGAWSAMVSGKTLMFSDLGLDQLLPIVVRVLRENLGNFTQGLLASRAAQPATQASAA